MQVKTKNIFYAGVIGTLYLMLLNGCANQAQLERIVDSATTKAYNQINSKLNSVNNAPKTATFNVSNSRYVDREAVEIPAAWKTKKIAIYATGQPLAKIVEQMTRDTGITNCFQTEIRNKPINISYHGTLYDGLQQLSNQNNIAFDINENSDHPTLNWSLFATRTFQIAFLPGNTSFGVGGFGSNSSPATNQDSSQTAIAQGNTSGATLTGSALSVWQDLTTTINGVLSKDGKLSVNQASSSVTVTDTPFVIQKIAKIVEDYNKMLSARVALKIKILEVQLDNKHANGIDWNVAYDGIGFKGNFAHDVIGNLAKATPAGIGATILSGKFSIDSLIQALDQQGKLTVINEPTVASLNNQPNTISVGQNQAYVKQTDVTVDKNAGTITTSYTPGNIKTGLDITIIPHIQDDKIYLSLNLILSTLEAIQTQGGDKVDKMQNLSQIQLPQTQDRVFNQRIMAHNNNTIVLSGFKVKENARQDNQNFGSTALGGQYDKTSNIELVVLIQPTIIKGSI